MVVSANLSEFPIFVLRVEMCNGAEIGTFHVPITGTNGPDPPLVPNTSNGSFQLRFQLMDATQASNFSAGV